MKKVYYGKAVYNQKEINAVIKVLKHNKLALMDGDNVKILEKKVSLLYGKKFGLMVNSGSSANLLALSALNLKKNDEVITPALTFSTTVSPIIQLGLIPKFVDVEKNTMQICTKQIYKNISKNTKAIIVPNLLGNVANWKEINLISKKYKLKVIEDSADTIGYSYFNRNTGIYSDIVTTSFYASHIVTGAGFGGMVCFNNKKYYDKAKLLRGWGRSSSLFNESENINKRFNIKVSGIDYDAKYIFSELGYNFLPSEISAVFALEQLKKLKKNILSRQKNFAFLKKFFTSLSKYFYVPESYPGVKTGWLAYPILIKENSFISRKKFQIFLEKKNIQTRTIFTGNILRQPIMKKKKYKINKEGYKVSDYIMKNGILIGCHHGMQNKELNYIRQSILSFLNNHDKNNKY